MKAIPKFFKMTQDTYFGSITSLNRFSFLRSNTNFIKSCFTANTSTKLLFYKQNESSTSINPLSYVDPSTNRLHLLFTEYSNSSDLIKSKLQNWSVQNESHDHSIRNQLSVVFLGLDEFGSQDNFLASTNSLSEDFQYLNFNNNKIDLGTSIASNEFENYKGIPYFAVDITNSPDIELELSNHLTTNSLELQPPETLGMPSILTLSPNQSSLFAYSKSFMDWLMKNRFCPGCGSKVIPVDAGTRLRCTNDSEDPLEKCLTKKSAVNNVCFPRTDPVVIIAIVSSDKSKILLGLNKRHARVAGLKDKPMYSCIAGFMEPGETIEEATIREIWEETGVLTNEIKIIESQPWPFPTNLMIGCIGIVEFNGKNENINIDHDKELADCQWFDVADVRKASESDNLTNEAINLRLPMKQSIAYQLISKIIESNY